MFASHRGMYCLALGTHSRAKATEQASPRLELHGSRVREWTFDPTATAKRLPQSLFRDEPWVDGSNVIRAEEIEEIDGLPKFVSGERKEGRLPR